MSGAGDWQQIFDQLNDRSVSVRQRSAQSLQMAPSDPATAAELTDRLRQGLHDKNKYVRIAMAAALVRCQLDHDIGINTLSALLQDPHRDICTAAAAALGSLGKSAQDALPALQAAQSQAPASAQVQIRQAITKISENA